MKKKLMGAIAMLAMLAAPALAEAATRGFATANVNMRSGPSTAYPAVVVIPVGAPLVVNGCLSDAPWCDVSFARGRGWVAGRYIETTYRQNRVYVEPRYYRDLGVPIVTFEVGRYWDRYYRDRDFYRERDRWRRPPPSGGYWNAPPPRGDWDRPRPRDEWRDGRRDEWRDPRQGGGPNDGRWEQRYGDWNQDQRPRRENDRRDDDQRDEWRRSEQRRDEQRNDDRGQAEQQQRNRSTMEWDLNRDKPPRPRLCPDGQNCN
ncbi:SH3 domain-containing protein [Agrobacterium sp. NPDC090273]|uniref:SH3 domain-containing protein n=1 Tax=Agrobacterium sp. NPDC090273 TaxID=3363919 RepID=UPI00383BE412